MKSFDRLPELHRAIRLNDLNLVSELLEKGCDIEQKTSQGRTPLYVAVEEKNIEIAKLLIRSGAKLNQPLQYGETPLHCAANLNREFDLADADKDRQHLFEFRFTKAIIYTYIKNLVNNSDFQYDRLKYFVQNPDNRSILEEAIDDRKLNISIEEIEYYLTLEDRSEQKKLDIARLLLENGANIEAKDCRDRTPLYLAIEANSAVMVELLISFGGNYSGLKKVEDCGKTNKEQVVWEKRREKTGSELE